MTKKLAKLPDLLHRKLYKTGQTRGATPKEIYQNRVNRNSTVLIPWEHFQECKLPDDGSREYENGYIVLVNPDWYISAKDPDRILADQDVQLGDNAVLFFTQRYQYENFLTQFGEYLKNGQELSAPTSRVSPIGGNLLARLHGTTSKGARSQRIDIGFNETTLRGAGIRVYEYASSSTIDAARLQLEALFWMISDSIDVVSSEGMDSADAENRKCIQLREATAKGLLDIPRLKKLRIIDKDSRPVCPLCLAKISATDFFQRSQQAEGRETWDNTITEVSLFHIDELRVGKLQHKPYNLGWGHHFCNVVVKDSGIDATIAWMKMVIERNISAMNDNS
jgi:bstXI restriction endonuclease superfamily protein